MKRIQSRRYVRHKRVRAKIAGTSSVPRLSVFRSNRHISVQLIDDVTGKTIAFADDREPKTPDGNTGALFSGTPIERARKVGERIAKRAAEKKITSVVFDRGGYTYHGAVKAVADGARKGGLVL
mgnify:CR=1 FL=1